MEHFFSIFDSIKLEGETFIKHYKTNEKFTHINNSNTILINTSYICKSSFIKLN